MTKANGIAVDEAAAKGEARKLPDEFMILELFQTSGLVVLGPTDVERATGISKGTISGKLRSLADGGYLEEVTAGKYQIGPRLFQITTAYIGCVAAQLVQLQALTDQKVSAVLGALQNIKGAFTFGQGQEGQS
ncbi:MAG: helix-turn-helix domain-containing protein [Planctomycetaceae bacterium]|nr:hypothetical protein [Planctomycetaceae bacterium]